MFSVFVVLSIALSATPGQQQTVEYKLPGGFDRVTYDSSLIQRNDLDRVMEISPVLSKFNFMTVPEEVELCKSEDKRYKGCGTDRHFNLDNAKLNLDSISDRIKRLDPENYPPELKPVAEYLRKLQSLSLWREQQKLEFDKTDNWTLLEASNGSIDPKASCDTSISKIRNSSDRATRVRIARHDWSNCVWAAITSELGPYPKKDWDLFLNNHGITEQEINTEQE
jgi:hypothetical protein